MKYVIIPIFYIGRALLRTIAYILILLLWSIINLCIILWNLNISNCFKYNEMLYIAHDNDSIDIKNQYYKNALDFILKRNLITERTSY